jgi:hypothetical protein
MPTSSSALPGADETSAVPGCRRDAGDPSCCGFIIHFAGFVKTIWQHLLKSLPLVS